MNDSPPANSGSAAFNWSGVILVTSLAAVPASYAVYAHLSGQNHFGQGLEHSFSRAVFWAVQGLAFFGSAISPCFRARTSRRETLLMLVGALAFLVVEALSFVFIAFNGFPD